MAYTYPATRSTGYIMGASTWNAEVVDNLRWLGGDSPSCKAYMTVVQSVPTGVSTGLEFGGEFWDIGGMHSTAVFPSRFTAPVGGRYQIIATISFPPAGSYFGFLEPIISMAATGERSGMVFTAASGHGINSVSEFQIPAGGYVEMVAWHNFASPLDLLGSCVVKWVGQ